MSKMIKRFDLTLCASDFCRARLSAEPDGDYVRHEDYEQLRAEVEQLRAESERYLNRCVALFWAGNADDKTAADLRAAEQAIRRMDKAK